MTKMVIQSRYIGISSVENTSAGGRIDRITGKLVSIEGNKQASGVMLDISAASLVSGTGMKITSGEKNDIRQIVGFSNYIFTSSGRCI